MMRILLIMLTLICAPFVAAWGANFDVASGTGTVNCGSLGASPGDTITLAGGTRGPLKITNCNGVPGKPIIIRNNPSQAQVVIRRASAGSGDFIFNVINSEHFVVDGTGGFTGSPGGHCGWLGGQLGTNCGIKITRTVSGDSPTSFLKFSGLFRNFTVRGLHIDGRYWGSNPLNGDGAGIGIHQNDRSVKMSSHPTYWRENIVYEQNYIHNTMTEGMYIGANWDASNPDLPLRNITVQDNYFHDVGRNAATLKSVVSGDNIIRRNVALRTGLQGRDSGRGAFASTSHMKFHHNIAIDTGGQCFFTSGAGIPSSYTGGYMHAVGNLGVRCGSLNFSELGYGVSTRITSGSALIEEIIIEYNTFIDTASTSINVSSEVGGSNIFVGNNLVTDPKSGAHIRTPGGTISNNRTGTIASMRFVDASTENFRLTSGSPAVDAGALPAPSTDLDGVSRPLGNNPDQGAFEYDASLPSPAPPNIESVR